MTKFIKIKKQMYQDKNKKILICNKEKKAVYLLRQEELMLFIILLMFRWISKKQLGKKVYLHLGVQSKQVLIKNQI